MQPAFFDRGELGKGSLTPRETLVCGPHSLPRLESRHVGAFFNN
jgi:hypothetical protein